ncbi:MAG: nitroreductase [Parasphingorhabdus sp.]|nr:nitroreductase [Parasphingorhabdus sp.]
MFNDLSSPRRYLATRRSGKPRNMIAPGPSREEIGDIVESALRTPDHGKLSPWRVIVIGDQQRTALGEAFAAAYRADKPAAGRLEIQSLIDMATQAPALLVVLSSPVVSTKIPLWEQEQSCGAFVMNILHAAHARGYVGSWLTGWPAYCDAVRDLFGEAPERIAGFVYLGTSTSPLEERPRPQLETVLSDWKLP